MVRPIERQNVADTVFYTMLNMIIEGEWKQESMIPSENELREGFSVSRDTVRQAIHRLKALGILQSKQGKGTYVQKIDTGFYLNLMVPAVFLNEDDGICILEFMKAIQVESVRIVCERASDEEIAVLSDYLALMRSNEDGDYENYFNHDIGYHFYLVRLTKNNLFEKAMDIIENILHVRLREIVEFHGSEKSLQQHEECFDAIQKRDAERAVSIMAEHYDMLTDRLRQWLKKDKAD